MKHRVYKGQIYRDLDLDTAAREQPESELGRLMRQRPISAAEQRRVRERAAQ